MALKPIENGQFATEILACDPVVRHGTAICHLEGACKTCAFALKYQEEHPEAFEERF